MERIDDTVGMEPFEKALASIEPTDLDDTASQITLSDSAAQKYSKNRLVPSINTVFPLYIDFQMIILTYSDLFIGKGLLNNIVHFLNGSHLIMISIRYHRSTLIRHGLHY